MTNSRSRQVELKFWAEMAGFDCSKMGRFAIGSHPAILQYGWFAFVTWPQRPLGDWIITKSRDVFSFDNTFNEISTPNIFLVRIAADQFVFCLRGGRECQRPNSDHLIRIYDFSHNQIFELKRFISKIFSHFRKTLFFCPILRPFELWKRIASTPEQIPYPNFDRPSLRFSKIILG